MPIQSGPTVPTLALPPTDGSLRREMNLTAIVESSMDGIISTDAHGRVLSCNPAAAKLYGFSHREDMIGLPFENLTTAALAEQWPGLFERVRCGEVIESFESAIAAPDGQETEIAIVVSPVRDETDEIFAISLIVRDVSEQRSLEREVANKQAELARANAELKRSNAELERFAYVASHDLQEPLRMVTSYVQLLQRRYEGQLDKDADEFIGFAVDGAARMKRLINDLLALSRVMKTELHLHACCLEDLLSETIRDMEAALAEANATIEIGELPTLDVDSTQMRSVWQNLLANAVKYRSTADPLIEVTSRREGAEWIFSISDNGIGIREEDRVAVFDLFKRLNPHGEISGSGLGLAIVKNIVARHNGRAWVEPSTLGGSSFCFSLPVATKGR